MLLTEHHALITYLSYLEKKHLFGFFVHFYVKFLLVINYKVLYLSRYWVFIRSYIFSPLFLFPLYYYTPVAKCMFYVSTGLRRSKEGTGASGSGITEGCEPCEVGAGKWPVSYARGSDFNRWVISLALFSTFWQFPSVHKSQSVDKIEGSVGKVSEPDSPS